MWTTIPRRSASTLARDPGPSRRRIHDTYAPAHAYAERPCRPVEPERRLARAERPDPAGRQRLRRERVLDRGPAPAAAEGDLRPAPGDARGRRAARARARRR